MDWLGVADAGGGDIGLTFLPGKRGPSFRYPGRVYDRDLDADLAALRAAGVVRLVLLVEDSELERYGTPGRPPATWQPSVTRFPMPDGSPPAGLAAMDEILEAIESARGAGNVAVACMGGIGRTGTVAACALVARGHDSEAAIDMVRRVRNPAAVETPAQEAFVRAYAQRGRAAQT
ncbi:MAG: protein-tyrosine phosphatase family protein [Chloroflexota bacterium]